MQSFSEQVQVESNLRHIVKDGIMMEVNSEQSRRYRLIVNADDFGISAPRSRGIMQLIKHNRVTSVSVLVTGVNGHSVEHYSKQLRHYMLLMNNNNNQERSNNKSSQNSYSPNAVLEELDRNQGYQGKPSVGLHFNLTEGPCLSADIRCELINHQSNSFKGKTFIYQYIDRLRKASSPLPLPVKQLIKSQLRLQIQRFIQLFSFRPSHIDGHNHVHCIPQVAQIIGAIMQQYGVYKTRLPEELLQKYSPKSEMFVNNAKSSRAIFDKCKIIYPSNFIGCEEINRLDLVQINKKIEEIVRRQKEQHDKQVQTRSNNNNNNNNRFIQLMCHPGYADPLNGDEFNQSHCRQVQMGSLHSQLFYQTFLSTSCDNNKVHLSNYNYLKPSMTQPHKKRVLLYSKMNSGCGNWTTSLRLMQIFQELGYEVYTRSIEEDVDVGCQVWGLRQFLIDFQIALVIGVNLTRSGSVLYHATRSPTSVTNRVPYVLIVAGTDANIYFNKPQAIPILKHPIQHCELLISLSDSMAKLTQHFLQHRLQLAASEKQIVVVNQSSNLLGYQQKNVLARQAIYDCINMNYKLNLLEDKYIVFPASFRPVKDIQFLLPTLNQIIDREKGKLRVIILGPVLNQQYYHRCLSHMGRVEYLGSLQKQLYVQVLKNAMFLINTSISEGQSCSIQQAQECGQLCVVRNNQGNAQLVKHLSTGLLFNTPDEFSELYDVIKRNQDNLVGRIKSNALDYHKANFSVAAERQSYEKIFNQILPHNDMLLTYTDVHSVSPINIKLYDSVPAELLHQWFSTQNKPKRVIDIGCGSGIFSFTLINKFSTQQQSHLQLELYDYSSSVVSNCYYNCLQELGGRLRNVKSVQVKVSDMFDNVLHCKQHGNLYVANMPQTPFRNAQSRPDKNGSVDSFKFNHQLIRHFATFHEESMLIMLYSYMSNPNRFFSLLQELGLEIIWKSEKHQFLISSKQYDEMQVRLSEYIKQHIAQGRAEVTIVQLDGEETFVVPAQMLAIRKMR